MRTPTGIDPFLQMQQEMGRLFEDAFRGFGSPAEVKRRIEEAFRRRAQVDTDHVTIEAHSGR